MSGPEERVFELSPVLWGAAKLLEGLSEAESRIRRAINERLVYRDVVTPIDRGDVEEAREMMAAEGFIAEPAHTMRVEVGAEGIDRGDLVAIGEDGIAKRAGDERPIGVALGGDLIRFGGVHASVARNWPVGSIAMSMSYAIPDRDWDMRARARAYRQRQFQYTERFPEEVEAKAWKLVEQEMSPAQYFAFMEGSDIELENLAEDFRLIINKSGKFTILEGARGAGIVAQSGNVRSYKYPLGDEVSAFIDWFKHRTKELIAQWGCGTYGIVREGGE